MKHTIEVTQKDIDNGRLGPECCAISQAAIRIFSDDQNGATAITNNEFLTVCVGGNKLTGLLPIEARRFIRNFDINQLGIRTTPLPIKPFSFDVEMEMEQSL